MMLCTDFEQAEVPIYQRHEDPESSKKESVVETKSVEEEGLQDTVTVNSLVET